jgi:hypothetical protein
MALGRLMDIAARTAASSLLQVTHGVLHTGLGYRVFRQVDFLTTVFFRFDMNHDVYFAGIVFTSTVVRASVIYSVPAC